MLKPKKKISKKELKQDGLISAMDEATAFYETNKKMIGYAITALVVLILVVLVYVNNKRSNNEKAATELGRVFSLYDGGANDPRQYQAAIDGQPERGVMGLKKVVENYGGSESGEIARFYLANAYYQLGQFDEALKNFDDFSGSDKMLQSSAYAGVAACNEAKGNYAKAASSYEKAANVLSNNMNNAEYVNSAAHCYGLAGEKEKAIALYKRIKKDFPNTSYAREADRYISQLSA